MSDEQHQQDRPTPDWQKADARILGQILAAQNMVFALPDSLRIAEFYAQVLVTIPGITACRVCLGGQSAQGGEMVGGVCPECETLHRLPREDEALVPPNADLNCSLADLPHMRVIGIDSDRLRFGFFVLKIDQTAAGALYLPFISNLSGYVALVLENRWQKNLLQKANDKLECKVAERTASLHTANIQLQRERTMIARVMETSPVGITTIDTKGKITLANSQAIKILGLTKQEILQRTYNSPGWHIVDFAGNPFPAEELPFERVMASGQAVMDVRHAVEWPDGRRILLSINAAPLKNESGQVEWVVAAISDITEQTRAEDDLRNTNLLLQQSSRFTEALLSAIPTPVFYKDKQGRYLGCNQAFSELMGVASEEIKGKTVMEVWPGEYASTYHLKDLELMSSATRQVYEFTVRDKQGRDRPVVYIKNVFRDENNQVAGIIGAFLDITERKQAEDEVRRLNQKLEQRVAERTAQLQAANQELEAFCSSVSHDLRAPLRHIAGYVDLLVSRCRADLDDGGLHYIDTIAASVRQMGELIEALLQFSRTGRTELHQEKIDMNQVLLEALAPVQEECAGRAIEWVIGEMPQVRGDAALLRQVWANLLENAVKFTQTTEAALIEVGSSEEKDEIVFSVADNGVGFDMQYAGKLFGVFQRLHSREEFEGTGIGLATVQRIIARHGGRVWAEAEPDRGARFFFCLPRIKEEDYDRTQADSAGRGQPRRRRTDLGSPDRS